MEYAEILSFTLITNEKNHDTDTNFLIDKVNSDSYTSICLKTLNILSSSCYDIGLVKVENKKVVDMFHSYLKPYKPINKNNQKYVSKDTLEKINKAPSFKEIWDKVLPFLSNNVITGSHASERRFVYNCNKYDIDLPILAYSWCPCQEPNDAKYNYDHHLEEDNKRAIEYAKEWAASRLVSKYGKVDKNETNIN